MSDRALTADTDAKARKKYRLYEKHAAERDRADLENVLGTVSGRRFLWKQLVEAGVFRLSFVAGDHDSTCFNEGRRAQGNALFARIQSLNPDYYHQMAKEAHDLDELTKVGTVEPTKPVDEPEETES